MTHTMAESKQRATSATPTPRASRDHFGVRAGRAPSAHVRPRETSTPTSSPTGAAFSFADIAVMPPVQRLSAPDAPASTQVATRDARSAAALGTSGAAGPLPHRDAIQRSFGRHDVSNVQAHTDAAARDGARSMHAVAFAQGEHVAFADQPSLDVAAHEAAHVVQQRAGLTLRGGVGQRDDEHERHADAVASGVRNGESTEALLDTYAAPERPSVADGIQRFESEEHQEIGNRATGSKAYDLADSGKNPTDKFELTHGDIVALSGDVFTPADLFRLAAIPGDHGKLKGTRDEVIWGLLDPTIWEMRSGKTGAGPFTGKKDPRVEVGGIWEKFTFADDVKATVLERYQKLAAANASHFAAPAGRNKKQQPIATPDSAGGNYRTLHETAMRAAFAQGASGGPIATGMAQEAAAQHFLTDAFSAGHVRTPIAAIRAHWGERYPLFWYNLRHKIALDTAITMTQGTVIPANTGYTSILSDVEKMAPTLPAITLGDLLAKVFHDVDNEQGVALAGGGKVMGDAHLDTATENLAIGAIQAGNKDIDESFKLGGQTKTTTPMDAAALKKVRTLNGGTATQYAAELKMPTPDKKEPSQNWKAPDISALWDKHLLGNKGDTVGTAITKTVRTGAIGTQITDLATKFPVDAAAGILHPRAAYLSGFVGALQSDPKAGLLDIVSWTPHGMLTGTAQRDMVQDLAGKGRAGDRKENLGRMKMDQRVKLVKDLISSGSPGIVLNPNGVPDDLEAIFTLFNTLNHKGRLELFKKVEGREWTGDFNKTFPFRDELFKAMEKTGNNVDRLKNLLNAK